MKNISKILSSFLFFLSINVCFSQSLSQNDFIEDLEYIKKTLPIKHINLFAKIDSLAFLRKIDMIEIKTGTLDYDSFSAELFKLVVAIGDEHTFIERKFTKILPIQFELFKEGIYVKKIDTTNKAMLYSKLSAINNIPVNNIINLFKEVIWSENQSYFNDRLLRYLNNPAFLKGLGILNSDQEAEFTLIDKNNMTKRITLNAVPGNNITDLQLYKNSTALHTQEQKGNYWFNYNPALKTIYVNYNDCKEDPGNPFLQFNDELFKTINQYQPEKLVLDIRENSGGNSGILWPFITEIKKSYLNKKGKLFVLIGKKTFSSAVMNAVELKKNTNATLIGEATSGNINHYGEVRGFKLPKSKIGIAYSTRYWENWKGKKGPLRPDVKIQYSIKNYIQGKDEALIVVNKI
ncbi:S41 family peptidase [uncultured Pedobacter sp.]|uniref:S41 family peptidase n=1 Tax=uncultured Pedobacter sp. TaxID=246139 RepID=UPI0025EA113D|nr:S41 family peptidase [uncultured Pedobacter sp.]